MPKRMRFTVVIALVCLLLAVQSCALTDSVRQPRPMRVSCTMSELTHSEVREILEKHSYQITSENREKGEFTAARFPSPVFMGDQVLFQGGLYLKVERDSAGLTLYLYKAMNAEKETPTLEVSYDERNSPLYVKPFFTGMITDLRQRCPKGL